MPRYLVYLLYKSSTGIDQIVVEIEAKSAQTAWMEGISRLQKIGYTATAEVLGFRKDEKQTYWEVNNAIE